MSPEAASGEARDMGTAGLDGIEHRRAPGPPLEFNAYQGRSAAESLRRLPDNLLDALRALERSEVLRAGLGAEFTRAYLKLKQAEWRDYASVVSEWEVERTLDCENRSSAR
jgi:glutamine synthetase